MKGKQKKRFLKLLEILQDHQHLNLSDKSNRQYIAGLFVYEEQDNEVKKLRNKITRDGDGNLIGLDD